MGRRKDTDESGYPTTIGRENDNRQISLIDNPDLFALVEPKACERLYQVALSLTLTPADGKPETYRLVAARSVPSSLILELLIRAILSSYNLRKILANLNLPSSDGAYSDIIGKLKKIIGEFGLPMLKSM